ncbi:MAG: ATP-binding protein [Marinilabiliales bacterium]|nr:ATP-binding protein [Marinilabiliales bacterium]
MQFLRSYTPSKLSLITSLVTTLFTAMLLILNYLIGAVHWLFILIPAIFMVSFLTTSYILNYLINDKITPIYKTISGVQDKDKSRKRKKERNKDILAEVEHDVKIWADDKMAEIERLRDLEKYRKDFVGNVSHELKTPIFNIQGYILTLLDGGLEDPEINRLYLERTEKSIDRMINVVEDLESITKLESGELKLNPETFDISKLVEEVFELELREATERGISMKMNLTSGKPFLVKADKKRIFEAMRNLIGNAIKYGRKDGSVQVGFYDMNNLLLIEVSDDGIGIDKKDLPRIFERFYRVDKSRSRMQGGTGLGLSIVKHIIEAHKQKIHVKSTPDVGTTFTFALEKGKTMK